MKKYIFTVGLFDKDAEKQIIDSPEAKKYINSLLLNQYNIFAFTMYDVNGVYKMQSTNNIVSEPSIRIEIASKKKIDYKAIINDLKTGLNQETIMIDIARAKIRFI